MKSFALVAITMLTVLSARPAFASIDAFPSLIRFQDTAVGRRSSPQQVTVRNRGIDSIQSLLILDGSCSGAFDVQRVTCAGPARAKPKLLYEHFIHSAQ